MLGMLPATDRRGGERIQAREAFIQCVVGKRHVHHHASPSFTSHLCPMHVPCMHIADQNMATFIRGHTAGDKVRKSLPWPHRFITPHHVFLHYAVLTYARAHTQTHTHTHVVQMRHIVEHLLALDLTERRMVSARNDNDTFEHTLPTSSSAR